MSNTLLVGYDGSDGARRAVRFAAQCARVAGDRVIIAHVIEWSPYSFHTLQELEERHKRREEELERARGQIVEPLMQELQTQGTTTECMVRHGQVPEVLVNLAQEQGASQLIVGRRGHSKLQALLFGSVASNLVQISPVPVTVVP
jgi:nucleotide-binding universal stress UspA family protein